MSCNENIELKEAIEKSNTGADAIKRAPIVEYNTGVRCLRIGDISNNRPIDEWGFTSANQDVIEKFQLKKDDIVVARTGNTIGVVKYIDKDINSVYNNGLIRLKISKSFNSKFIYYNLISEDFKSYIYGISSGTSAQPNMKIEHMLKYKINNFNIEEQEKIANILSSLDDKIKLNNEMNNTLEEMAQSIFKRWFIDFEFSNDDGEPYKSSGGEMVDSGLGMIPNGWEVKSIYELAEYINGTSFKSKDYSDVGLPIIKIAELKNGITDSTKFFYGEKDQKFYLKNRDILFSWSGNPDTSIDTFIWDKGDAILNQHIFKVIPKFDNGYAFTYLMLKYLKSTFTHIARNKQTTGLGHVTVKDLKELKIALCFDKIKEFNKIVEPIVDLIFENNINTKLLNETRDGLLPKLMSGEIRVN